MTLVTSRRDPDGRGYFGEFGGRYVPETLVEPIEELERAYLAARDDPAFQAELSRLLITTSGVRRRCTKRGGSRPRPAARGMFLKREDLTHTGAHKINNAIGQALLAARMGKRRIVAETGAGQHGVASATACALLGLDCHVYMGAEDMDRQALERRAHAAARRGGPARGRRQQDAEGRDQRSDARLGHQRRRHLLPARLRARAAPLSAHGARVPVGHRQGGARADPRARRRAARPPSSRAWAAGATPWGSSTRSSTIPACGSLASRRVVRRLREDVTPRGSPAAAPASCRARGRSCCRTTMATSS